MEEVGQGIHQVGLRRQEVPAWSAQAESVELGARRTGVNGRRECLCPGGAIQQANSIKYCQITMGI